MTQIDSVRLGGLARDALCRGGCGAINICRRDSPPFSSLVAHLPRPPQGWPSFLCAIPQMSVAESEAEDSTVYATDLLAYDEEHLVHYLKRQDCGGEFDISSLAGVALLSGSQREDLTQKLG